MLEVTLSERHQVEIPEEILESLNFKAGQKFDLVVKGNLISLVPKQSIASFRGILKGANTEDIRDRNDRV
ncbi:AbrB/MazE/SpoVT family DNA-binding domain-containing protein [Methylomonas sp. UP202]|uniref:AbrB/MazE/SpoVT family DNA-binding domain-containing protein n=1 Tax=Methylomonas sp. UP202 TaxID=3040943 RepID=UPI00247971E6|nr:AbrB/MazE/SpoVT family DNA-binding domain-containing protein [Methylomonas sp. UP202]WGS84835.1 AbrB/MazE/SpoVT family DNA-binding domain-containing protein [Methylomonas sp. UP202]